MATDKNNLTTYPCDETYDALCELAEDRGASDAKATEQALETGLAEMGYLDGESWISTLLGEMGRFSAYSAAVLLGVQTAVDVELMQYAVLMLVLTSVALVTQRYSHHLDSLIGSGTA